MSLGQKILAILFLTVIGLTVILQLATRVLLLRKFQGLEQRETRNAVERAQNAINDAIQTLSATTNDYGAWDKTLSWKTRPPSRRYNKNSRTKLYRVCT
jgi:sensor domain CHASE-containing protein